ncbi:MAG: hypothetical protein IH994_00130 [Proteobacteria bacterium]|nr:hypothetical protein [Pseudomonadota bacterium]
MAEIFPLAATFANIGLFASQPDFELQFSQLQNTIIRRVNKEIKRINESGASDRQTIAKLQRDGLKLADSLPLIEAYRNGNSNNLGQIQQLLEDADTLSSALGEDDAVSQAEVDAFNAKRDEIVERLNNLYFFVLPDIVDGNTIQTLKLEIDNLNALSPVVGSKSTDQENIDATAAVSTLQNHLLTALTTTQNTVSLALDLEQNIQAKQAEILADFTDLTTVEAIRKATEIENIKGQFANLLIAISLSFETNSSFAFTLNKFLSPFRPEPGSVLNLFI